MKSLKIFSVCLIALFGMSGCANSWLDQNMTGSSITQEEYESLSNTIVTTVNGIYAYLYTMASSDHDDFGQKAFDIASDIYCGDIAITKQAYGWFEYDAITRNDSRAATMWTTYFSMIMNANAVLRTLDRKPSITDEERGAYAQALALRGFCYSSIANYFSPAAGDYETPAPYGLSRAGSDYDLCPLYTQNDTTKAGLPMDRPLSTVREVRDFIRADLTQAIQIYDEIGFSRSSKLAIDGTLARALLAYNYLQMGWAMQESDEFYPERCYQEAFNTAMDVINSGEYSILSYDEVLTTGFVDVNSHSWMWGLDVTNENKTALASFWGHMDTHTYSYAYSGATKACDRNLYDQLVAEQPGDIRIKWFTSAATKCVNDWKFYDLKRGVTADEIDRNWLNDYVYMRVEEMYLVAAEAAWRAGDLASCRTVLRSLLEERIPDASVVDNWSAQELINKIYLNWRIEMWGEGRGYITFKRFYQDGKTNRTLGDNNFNKERQVQGKGYGTAYLMPSSESSYNPYVSN